MTEQVHTLRPGLLVSLSTGIRGNVSYRKNELETAHLDDDGAQRARWETERIVSDPAEHVAATKLRSKVRCLIVGVCSQSAFGLLCPENKAQELRDAIVEARALVDEFNRNSSMTHMSVNVIYGRIEQSDVEAVRAITGEIRSLMEDMAEGLKAMDVKAVRDACNKARSVGDMLSPEAQGRVEVAIDAARQAARKIVKAGEEAAGEVDRAVLAKIDMARTSFLDIDIDSEVATPVMSGRALDLQEV